MTYMVAMGISLARNCCGRFLQLVLADFGVSHRLSAFAAGGGTYKTASKVTSVLTGAAALGPLQVRVPCWRGWCGAGS